MPTFNILLAYDITKYGCMEVEADTWEAAVASLTHDSWYDSCHEPGDDAPVPPDLHGTEDLDDVGMGDLRRSPEVCHEGWQSAFSSEGLGREGAQGDAATVADIMRAAAAAEAAAAVAAVFATPPASVTAPVSAAITGMSLVPVIVNTRF